MPKLKTLEVGCSYRLIEYHHRIIHIRAIIDESQVIFSVYSARKGWQYCTYSSYFFYLMARDEKIKKNGITNASTLPLITNQKKLHLNPIG